MILKLTVLSWVILLAATIILGLIIKFDEKRKKVSQTIEKIIFVILSIISFIFIGITFWIKTPFVVTFMFISLVLGHLFMAVYGVKRE